MPPSASIVVTGASSGIGRDVVFTLRENGYDVIPTVRKEADAEALRSDGFEPVMLDLAEPTQIDSAVDVISSRVQSRGLSGLINNAGHFLACPLECTDMTDFRLVFEVNVFGTLKLTQKLLPLVRQARGRIVNIGSLAGQLSYPFAGPYAASKFALEGMSDALRRELEPWGIHVTLIEPANIDTPMWSKSLTRARELEQSLPQQARKLYEGHLTRAFELIDEVSKHKDPPELVTKYVLRALTRKRPKPRYFPGPARIVNWLVWLTPAGLMDWIVSKKLGLGRL